MFMRKSIHSYYSHGYRQGINKSNRCPGVRSNAAFLPCTSRNHPAAVQRPKPHRWSVQTLKEARAESGADWRHFSRMRASGNKTLKSIHLNFPPVSPYSLVRGRLGTGNRNSELMSL